ncbi:cytochrome oxidase c subunit VIb-domain-containing protein [Thelephora terrestris]|uniref:Cytochrome oxidase c subunit VIb-domain-containing protein n=1 Tax=Thelephora terrestris TaxID=56493 RepID=A0A9P6LA36_9AGAM|nr:cytochrome oxidase c subunit VIb-domain-containing protein [Thelephora terrestris]
MGWFGSSTPEPTAVSREGRKHCWDGRDAYFKCLDNVGVLKPGDEGKACSSEKVAYEKSCVKSWIDYFNKRRVLAEQQKGVLEQMKNQSNSS